MPEQGSANQTPDRFADSQMPDLARVKTDEAAQVTPMIAVTDEMFPQVVENSKRVPTIVDLWASWCEPCKTLTPALERLAAEYGGRFLLATVDIDAAPNTAKAFGVQSVPTVVALIGGQAIPLFTGAPPADRIKPVIEEVLKVAGAKGITGTVAVNSQTDGTPAPPPIPPLHRKAMDAIEKGDLAGASAAYREALSANPGDGEAKAALASVELMIRVEAMDADATYQAALADPKSITKALAAADLEVASAAPDAAFDRLLPLVRISAGTDRETLRARLVEYFEIVGLEDPRVAVARRALATALF
ncbi:MAG: tetratricopeptide repeat protein [Bifidobacteriaceae bacterium]|nr:tetratricopeptide repeat protein [Bifidobacteriaceae bacterium]